MECLVTKLKGTVNDDTLKKLGEFRLMFDMESKIVKDSNNHYAHQYIYLDMADDFSVSVIGSGYIGTNDTDLTSKTLELSSRITPIFCTDDVEGLSIIGKYSIKEFQAQYCRDYEFDIDDLCQSTCLQKVFIRSDKVKGDISNLFKNVDMSGSSKKALFVVTSRYGSTNGNTALYGDVSKVCERLAKHPLGCSNITLGVPNITGTVKGVLSDYYGAEAHCGDVAFNVAGLNFSGHNVSVVSLDFAKAVLNGDLSSLKTAAAITMLQWASREQYEISGNIVDIVQGRLTGNTVKFASAKSKDVQDLSGLNMDKLCLVSNQESTKSWYIPCTWTKSAYQGKYILALENIHMQSHTEDMLADMATKSVNPAATLAYMKVISIAAHDLATATETINTAVGTLTGKGITVTINYYGEKQSLMKAAAATKYAIVYKENKLLVPPTDLSRATVGAAYDCTYKEFDSYAEAQAYVDAHGLEYKKSE